MCVCVWCGCLTDGQIFASGNVLLSKRKALATASGGSFLYLTLGEQP